MVSTGEVTDKLRELQEHQIDALINSFIRPSVNPWDAVPRGLAKGDKINTFVIWAAQEGVLDAVYERAQDPRPIGSKDLSPPPLRSEGLCGVLRRVANFTGSEAALVQQLHTALLSAFPTIPSLQQFTQMGLGENLESIAGGNDLSESAFNLIQWAKGQGRLEELIKQARLQNPGNPELGAFAGERTSNAVPISNLPAIATSYFTGREEILGQLAEAFQRPGRQGITQTQGISGLGGIGKTQTALEFARRCRMGEEGYPRFDAYLWRNADTTDTLLAGFAGIARTLGLPEANQPDQNRAVEAARGWLADPRNARFLLIFDNADEPALLLDWLPPQGYVLITSRSRSLRRQGVAAPIALDRMPEAEALALFQQSAGLQPGELEEWKAAQTLASALDCLPLALEQAAAYISARGTTFRQYLALYGEEGTTLFEGDEATPSQYPRSVTWTWNLSFGQVQQRSPASARLLERCVFVSPNSIPMEYVLAQVEGEPPESEAQRHKLYDTLLTPLTAYSLITKLPEDAFRLHRLVQAVLRDRLQGEARRVRLEETIGLLNDVFPYPPDFANWAVCARLREAMLACAGWIATEKVATRPAGLLVHLIGYYLEAMGLYGEAEPLYAEALQIWRAALPAGHPDIATSLNNLAGLYRSQGRTTEAEPLYAEAVGMLVAALGVEHPTTKSVVANHEICLRDMGRGPTDG